MKSLFLPTLILSLWVLNSCSFFNRNPVVLQINSHKLTARQFAKRLVQKIHALNIQDVKSPEMLEKLKRQLITDLIMEFLIKEFAQSHSVSISKKELHQALQRIKSKYPDEEAFEWYLKRKKTRAEEWTEHIKNNLLSKKVMQKMGSKTSPPSLKEIKEYYQNHPSLFKQKPRVLIYHIFHKQKEVLIKIEKSLKLEKNLMKMVKKFIKDPLILKPQWVEKGILPIFDQAFHLKKKEISPIWSSSYGHHLIQVLDKQPSQQIPFEKVKQSISQKLREQRQKAIFIKWLDEQSKKVKVLKNEAALGKIKVDLL